MDDNETNIPSGQDAAGDNARDQLQPSSGDFVIDAQGRYYYILASRPHAIQVKQNAFASPSTFSGADTPGNQDGSRQQARFNTITQLTINTGANLMYVADSGNQRVRRIDLNTNQVSTILTVASAQAAAGVTSFGVLGVAADTVRTIYITDNLNFVVWTYNVNNSRLQVFAGKPGQRGTTDGIGMAARFYTPGQCLLNTTTSVLNVQDNRITGEPVVRQIAPNGEVKTIAKKLPT